MRLAALGVCLVLVWIPVGDIASRAVASATLVATYLLRSAIEQATEDISELCFQESVIRDMIVEELERLVEGANR